MKKASLAMTKSTPLSRLEGHYLKALRQYLHDKTGKVLSRRIGNRVVTIGLDTLDLVRMHEQALAKLLPAAVSTKEREAMIDSAAKFFTEAVMPLEETHRIALEASAHLMEIIKVLRRRKKELVRSKRELKREVRCRKVSEVALKNSQITFYSLVSESKLVEVKLKAIAHQIMLKNERQKYLVSTRLREKTAQMLIGLHIRLLELKRELNDRRTSIKQEIAITQQLVKRFRQTIQRFLLAIAPTYESKIGYSLPQLPLSSSASCAGGETRESSIGSKTRSQGYGGRPRNTGPRSAS